MGGLLGVLMFGAGLVAGLKGVEAISRGLGIGVQMAGGASAGPSAEASDRTGPEPAAPRRRGTRRSEPRKIEVVRD